MTHRAKHPLTRRRIWTNWRRKSTEGLPGSMLILWSICATLQHCNKRPRLTTAGGVPFGVYAIVQNFNFALKFQPQAFASLTLIAWGQTLYYHNKWRVWTATVATIALAASFGIMELILILTLRVRRLTCPPLGSRLIMPSRDRTVEVLSGP